MSRLLPLIVILALGFAAGRVFSDAGDPAPDPPAVEDAQQRGDAPARRHHARAAAGGRHAARLHSGRRSHRTGRRQYLVAAAGATAAHPLRCLLLRRRGHLRLGRPCREQPGLRGRGQPRWVHPHEQSRGDRRSAAHQPAGSGGPRVDRRRQAGTGRGRDRRGSGHRPRAAQGGCAQPAHDSVGRFVGAQSGRVGAGDRQPVSVEPECVARHRLRDRPHQPGHPGLRGFRADRCRDQPGQFGRRARERPRRAGRHQHGHLQPERRLSGHRVRRVQQPGAARDGRPAEVRRSAAGRYRLRGDPSPDTATGQGPRRHWHRWPRGDADGTCRLGFPRRHPAWRRPPDGQRRGDRRHRPPVPDDSGRAGWIHDRIGHRARGPRADHSRADRTPTSGA